jgi:hypothetical protein
MLVKTEQMLEEYEQKSHFITGLLTSLQSYLKILCNKFIEVCSLSLLNDETALSLSFKKSNPSRSLTFWKIPMFTKNDLLGEFSRALA